jgi:hypothetical protein
VGEGSQIPSLPLRASKEKPQIPALALRAFKEKPQIPALALRAFRKNRRSRGSASGFLRHEAVSYLVYTRRSAFVLRR